MWLEEAELTDAAAAALLRRLLVDEEPSVTRPIMSEKGRSRRGGTVR